jgi:hypothetical protein
VPDIRATLLRCAALLAALVAVAGCSALAVRRAPDAAVVTTPGIDTSITDQRGFQRARIDRAGPGDAAVLAQFDATGAGPAGFVNLIALTEQRYRDTMAIEVIAEVDTAAGGRVIRILRLTADQAPFVNVRQDGTTIGTGRFFFRGGAEVYARLDGGALARGVGELQNMIVDFDAATVAIDLRTPFDPAAGSAIETELRAADLPFNIRTGTFGGPVTLATRSADTGEIVTEAGVLRGHIRGDEAGLSRLVENMTGSGLFTVGGAGSRLQADGVFWGSQLNYTD